MVRRMVWILVLVQVFHFESEAQQLHSFRVNSVSGDSSNFSGSVYRYPNFIGGKVVLKNNKAASAMLNYNRLSGQILFINNKGDTLEFAEPGRIEYVAIANDTFYYFDNSFVQLVSQKDGIQLLKKETIEYNGKEKKGAYGNYSATTAANSINKVPDVTDLKKIGVDENSLYVSSKHYYIRGQNGNVLPATKKNFHKLFAKNKVDEYLSKNKVNFMDETELLHLLDYLQQ